MQNNNFTKEIFYNFITIFNFKIHNNTCENPTFKKRIHAYWLDYGKYDFIFENSKLLELMDFKLIDHNGVCVFVATKDKELNLKNIKNLSYEYMTKEGENYSFLAEVGWNEKIPTENFDYPTNLGIEYILNNLIISKIKGKVNYKLLICNDTLHLFKHSTDFLDFAKKRCHRNYHKYFNDLFDKSYQMAFNIKEK